MTDDDLSKNVRAKPWNPHTDFQTLRYLLKTVEESSELSKACIRALMQGLHEINPSSGETNISHIEEEIADNLAMCNLCMTHFNLDEKRIVTRIDAKQSFLVPWLNGELDRE